MGANSSYKAMCNIVEQAKEGSIFTPDDFTTFGTPDAVRSGLSRLCRNGLSGKQSILLFRKSLYSLCSE